MSTVYPIHKAPYTNFHDLNLDWVIEALNDFNTRLTNFVSLATIKYADPIQWDITSQYEANTVVVDSNGNAYLSVQPVPSGVSLDRTEYWTKIGNFDELWADVKKAITPIDEGHSTTATAARAVDDLVWVDGSLVRVTEAMDAGDAYVAGSNCVSSSTNEVLHYLLTTFNDGLSAEQNTRQEADAQLQAAITAEQQAREEADTQLQAATTAEQQAREEADNGLQSSIDQLEQDVSKILDYANVKSYGAKGDGSTDDTTAFTAAIASGKDLFIPDGEYIITGAINIGSPLMTSGAIVVASGITITMGAPVAPCTLHFRVSGGGKYNITAGETIADWFIDSGMADVFSGGSIKKFTGTIKFPTPGDWAAQSTSLTANTKYNITQPVTTASHTKYDFCGGVVAFGPSGVINIKGSGSSSQIERIAVKNATFVATAEDVQKFFDIQYAQRVTIDSIYCIGGRKVANYVNTINIYTANVIHDTFYASPNAYCSFLLDETSAGVSGISGNASIRFYNCLSSFNRLTGDCQQFQLYNSNDMRDVFIDQCECASAQVGIKIQTLEVGNSVWNIFIRGYVSDACVRGFYAVNCDRSQITLESCYFNATDRCVEFKNSSGVISNCQFIGSKASVGIVGDSSQGLVINGNQFINIDQCIAFNSVSASQIAFNTVNRNAKYAEAFAMVFSGTSNGNRVVNNSIIPSTSDNYYTAAFRFENSCTGNIIGLNSVSGTELSNAESDLQKISTVSAT